MRVFLNAMSKVILFFATMMSIASFPVDMSTGNAGDPLRDFGPRGDGRVYRILECPVLPRRLCHLGRKWRLVFRARRETVCFLPDGRKGKSGYRKTDKGILWIVATGIN